MTTTLRVGDPLYGYCGGWFGRDSYEDKRVEAIGSDWVVARSEYGLVVVATFENGFTPDYLCQYTVFNQD